jgi:hypothetical protein
LWGETPVAPAAKAPKPSAAAETAKTISFRT